MDGQADYKPLSAKQLLRKERKDELLVQLQRQAQARIEKREARILQKEQKKQDRLRKQIEKRDQEIVLQEHRLKLKLQKQQIIETRALLEEKKPQTIGEVFRPHGRPKGSVKISYEQRMANIRAHNKEVQQQRKAKRAEEKLIKLRQKHALNMQQTLADARKIIGVKIDTRRFDKYRYHETLIDLLMNEPDIVENPKCGTIERKLNDWMKSKPDFAKTYLILKPREASVIPDAPKVFVRPPAEYSNSSPYGIAANFIQEINKKTG